MVRALGHGTHTCARAVPIPYTRTARYNLPEGARHGVAAYGTSNRCTRHWNQAGPASPDSRSPDSQQPTADCTQAPVPAPTSGTRSRHHEKRRRRRLYTVRRRRTRRHRPTRPRRRLSQRSGDRNKHSAALRATPDRTHSGCGPGTACQCAVHTWPTAARQAVRPRPTTVVVNPVRIQYAQSMRRAAVLNAHGRYQSTDAYSTTDASHTR